MAVLEVLAVNPNATTVGGDPAVADLASVPGELDGVIVMVNTPLVPTYPPPRSLALR